MQIAARGFPEVTRSKKKINRNTEMFLAQRFRELSR